MEKKRSPNRIDVVQIVRQIRQQIEEQHMANATAASVRQQVRAQIRNLLQQAPYPGDVKKDLLDQDLLWIFDPQSFWYSRRPVWGAVINVLRRILRPIVKLFFNPDPLLHHIHRMSYWMAFQQQLIEDLMVERELERRARARHKRSHRSGSTRMRTSRSETRR